MGYYDLSLQRQTQIENGLLSLMKDLPFETISVKDLADRLGIARKTFYHYFPNKKACLEALTDRLICECSLALIREVPDHSDSYRLYEGQLRFWMAHGEFLKAIIRNRLSTFFVERCIAYVRQEDATLMALLGTAHMDCDEDVLFFYVSAEILLLLKWCDEDFPLSVDEMVRKRMRLLHEPLMSPINRPL